MGQVTPANHSSPKAPRDRSWDWSGTDKFDQILEHGGWDTAVTAHAWHDPDEDPDHLSPREKQAYKLPHHELIDGRLEVVWNGVVAAMAVVNGARGGVDVPERDRRPVYQHLAGHYREFGEEPPEFQT